MEQNKPTDVDSTKEETTVETDVKKLQERLAFLEGESKKAFENRDKAKQKAKELEASLEEMKKNQESKLKESGDYETLNKKLLEKESLISKQIENLKMKSLDFVMKGLAVKHNMNDPEDVKLLEFKAEVDDDLNVQHIDQIEKLIEELKNKKPYLFKQEETKKVVPRVDNAGNKIDPTKVDHVKLTALDIMKQKLDQSTQHSIK